MPEQHTFLFKSADNTLIPWSALIVETAAESRQTEAASFRLPKGSPDFIERGPNVLS